MTAAMEHLNEKERARLAIEYEYVSEIFAKRHGVSIQELAENARWIREHRAYVEALKRGAALSVIGFLATALLLAIWEGIKVYARRITP